MVPARNPSRITVPIQQPALVNLSVKEIEDKAILKKDMETQVLISDLNRLNENLSSRVICDVVKVAENMASVYKVILGCINNDKSLAVFKAQWDIILKFFKEKENDGVGANRIFRGVTHWNLSHEDYNMFTSLWNLIEATNRWGVSGCKKYVEFGKITREPITEAGVGRILSYYN